MAESCPNPNNPLTAANPPTGTSPIVGDIQKAVTGANPMYDIANKLAQAAVNYNAINSVINQLIGYEAKWFRAVPQQRSKDVIFQEYTLYNVEECPITVKVVLPSGMPPDSVYNYDLMGLEYNIPFEVQIDKKYWESLAGFGTAPQKKDIVYFPISNKLFQVESSYLFRGFMEQETTWKCNLVKYQPMAARKEPEALQQTIDQYTTSVEEVFGEAIDADVAKLVNDKQFSAHNSLAKDKYKSLDPSLNTISKSIEMYGTVVAQSFYDLQTPTWYDAVTYNATDSITVTSDRSIIAWVQPRKSITENKSFNVASITPIITLDPCTFYTYDSSLYSEANYSIVISSPAKLPEVQIDENVVISRPGALNFYGRVVAISIDPLTYYCMINPFVQENLAAIKSDWDLQKDYKLVRKEPISILDGVNDFGEHIFSVNVFANQYISINYGHTYADDDAYVIRLDDKLYDNEWYGIIVNIGNSWQQYNVYVWKKHETDKNAKLQNIFYETLQLYPEEIHVSEFTINKSPGYLTNLRLYSATIEEEKQSNELLSYFIKDGDQTIIADLADARLMTPYITRQR
jgi:hypothetical protein